MSLSEVETTYSRLVARKGVKGVVITNREGQTIKSSLSEELSKTYGRVISNLISTAESTVTSINDQENLKFLRLRTSKHEIMISPSNEYLLIVVQDPLENASQ